MDLTFYKQQRSERLFICTHPHDWGHPLEPIGPDGFATHGQHQPYEHDSLMDKLLH